MAANVARAVLGRRALPSWLLLLFLVMGLPAAKLSEGSRALDLPWDARANSYLPPLHDESWSNEALIELLPADETAAPV